MGDSPSPAADPEAKLRALKERHKRLEEARITAEADRRNAEAELARLRAEAESRYGTADLDRLRAKLAEMRAENERKVAEYEAHLDSVEAALAEVERRFEGGGGEGSP
jgi:chromosome segregation ATPase